MTLEGLSGGVKGSSHTDDNGNGKGKQQQKQKEKSEYSTFKYSTRLTGPLHEAIMLGSEPFFLTYSPVIKSFDLVRKIEEVNRILVPPYPEEYPYDPIEFQSKKELQEYFDLANNETVDSLYQKIKGQVSLYIDQDEEIIILMSGDILWTFFQDLYSTTHYYDVNGKINGIGKSSIGHVFEAIAYRAIRMTDPSAANVFRSLGRIEAGQCVIIMDEADRVHKDTDMLSILKEGYQSRAKVPKTNPSTFKQEWYYCYCFKIRIAEEQLRGNITKGVIDRSFQIKAIRGRPKYDIKEVLQPANRIERFGKLHNDMLSLRKLLLCYRLIHFEDRINDIGIGLDNRDKELCKPLLQLFYGSKSYGELKKAVMSFLIKKNKRKRNTVIDPVLFEMVISLINRKKTLQLKVNDIWEVMINGLPVITHESNGTVAEPGIAAIPGVYISSKPNDYQTYDFDTVYRNTFTRTLEGFGAEHGRKMDERFLTFDPDKLVRVGKQFDFIVTIDRTNDSGGILDMPDIRAVMLSYGNNDENVADDGHKDESDDGETEDKSPNDGMTATQPPSSAVIHGNSKTDKEEWLLGK